MFLPLLIKELCPEGFAVIEIDVLGNSAPVQEGVSEGDLDMLAVLGKGE